MKEQIHAAGGLRLGDRIYHPRLGHGHMLGQMQDDTVVVMFDKKTKPDVLFPYLLRKVEEIRTGHRGLAS